MPERPPTTVVLAWFCASTTGGNVDNVPVEITVLAGSGVFGTCAADTGGLIVGLAIAAGGGSTGADAGTGSAARGAAASLFRGTSAEGGLGDVDATDGVGVAGRGEGVLPAITGGVTTTGFAIFGEPAIAGGREIGGLGRTIVGIGGGGGAGATITGLQRVPGAGGPLVALSGLRKRNVMRSLSPMAL